MYWEIDVQLYNIASTGCLLSWGMFWIRTCQHHSASSTRTCTSRPRSIFLQYVHLLSLSRCCFRDSLVIVVVMSYGLNASDKAAGSESRVKFGMIAFSLTVLIVDIKIWMIADRWTVLLFSLWFGSAGYLRLREHCLFSQP